MMKHHRFFLGGCLLRDTCQVAQSRGRPTAATCREHDTHLRLASPAHNIACLHSLRHGSKAVQCLLAQPQA